MSAPGIGTATPPVAAAPRLEHEAEEARSEAEATAVSGSLGLTGGPHGEEVATPVPGSVDDAAALLADGVIAALPGWVERCVASACERAGVTVKELGAQSRAAGLQCAVEIGSPLRDLLATDVDEQQSTPLSVLRSAVRFPTQVLAAGGVPAPDRDDFDASRFPDDPYGLTPASFADIDPELGPIGIAWGAAKAFEVLQRRRSAEPARRGDSAEPARRGDTGEQR